jgi:hypothetical protein
MEQRRRHLAARRGFESWAQRFSDALDESTTLEDLSDSTLASLIQAGEDSTMAIYEFIMGVRGMGPGTRFFTFKTSDKMAIMDITLFLLDQLRFECMRRLGWVENYPARGIPMLDLVEQFGERFSSVKYEAPALSAAHPRYSEYEHTFEGDREAFIRRLIPQAILSFQEKVRKS